MPRTYSNIPEPRYVERARHCDNNIGDGEAASYYSVTGLYQDDGGFVMEYENGGMLHIPMMGTDDIIVDIDEDNKMINIHLDAEVRAQLARMLLMPLSTPAQTVVPVITSGNAQELLTLQELANALKPYLT